MLLQAVNQFNLNSFLDYATAAERPVRNLKEFWTVKFSAMVYKDDATISTMFLLCLSFYYLGIIIFLEHLSPFSVLN